MSDSALLVVTLVCAMTVVAATGEELYDPMRPHALPAPPVAQARTTQGFELSAIVYSPDRRVAVVNGKALSEGERVGGARIVHIDRRAVELSVAGERLVLRLGNTKPME